MTKDTTATPAGRERAQESPPSGRQPMSAPDLDAIQARVDAADALPWSAGSQPDEVLDRIGYVTARVVLDADADLIAHAPADLAALLAEVKRLTAERDEARAAHAALLADVEALRRTYRTADGWPMSLIAVDRKLAAVIAKHAPKEARDE